jgi:PAS domain-containing protein
MLTGVGLGWLGEARLRAQSVARKALSQAQADAERAEEEAVRAEEEAARAEEQQLRAEEEAVRAEKEARHAEQQADRVERILSSFTDAFIVVDRHWLITYLNPPADALVGNTSTPHVGRLFWEVFREDPEGPFGAAFRRTLAGQDVYRGQAY